MRNLLLVLAVLFVACVPKHHVVNNGGIAIGAALTPIADGPQRLLFGGPKGPAAKTTDVTLAFSRSVETAFAPASVVRDDDSQAVEGTWQWFGQGVAIFHPKTRFAAATTYRVAPRLEGEAPFTFTTERPTLKSVSYDYDEKKNAHLVDISFDQAVSAKSVNESIRIEGRGGAKVTFRVLDESKGHTLTLQADAAVARLEDVVVIATTSLRGTEGPLGPLVEARLPLEGVGPFKATLTCGKGTGKCDVAESIEVELTRDVSERDLFRHLVVAAPAKADPDQLKAVMAGAPDSQTSTLDLRSLLAASPGQKYKVTIKAGLSTRGNEKLASDQVIEFETLDLPPSVYWRDLTAPVMVVESARPTLPLVLSATNVTTVDLVSAPLDEAQVADFLESKGRDADWVRRLPNSKTAKLDVSAPKNELKEASVTIAEGRAVGAAAAYVVGMHAPGVADDMHIFSVTDLGVNAKWSPHGALVWVTRLSTAAPVAGAKISLRRANAEVFTTTTDREGLAEIPAAIASTFVETDPEAPAPGAILFVKSAADWTYARLPELDAGLMSAVGYVFVERGLYRPGETVLAKGYFRAPSPRGFASLAGKPVYFEALDNSDHAFHAGTATLDAFGAFSAEVMIPKSARLGRAYFRARIGTKAPSPPPRSARDRWWRWGSNSGWPARDGFSIDSFRTPEFKVEVQTDRASFVRGETVTLTTTGTYLLGAPMTKVPVNVEVSRRRTMFTPEGLREFSVTRDVFSESQADLPPTKLEGKLDASGRATFTYSFPSALTAGSPESYAFAADVSDVSHAFSMTDAASVTVHPSDLYVGIKANLGAPPLIPGKTVRAELVAAGIDGTRRSGLATKVELFRSSDKGEPLTTKRSCSVKTDSAKLATCDFKVTDEGKHWLKASAVDGSGRALVSAVAFIVEPKNTKPPPPPVVAPTPPAPSLGLTFEQECARPATKDWMMGLTQETHPEPYRVGENALVCLRGAKTARGLFTVEREGILRRSPLIDFSQAESTLVKVPMTEDLYPNANVALAEVTGRGTPFPSGSYPTYRSSFQRLAVAVPAKKLAVTIDTEKEARPGAEVELRLQVKDGDGRPTAAQVTLWAVDEGIHLLMPRGVPQPENTFGEQRYSDVVEMDTRKNIFYEHFGTHTVKSPSIRNGATSVSDRALIGRSVFRPTAFWFTNITTDSNGVATVRADLPDNLTTWKVFAVAATAADAFGEGETSFATNKPLMIRPQLPRFLRAGDRFDGTVVIDSLVKEPLEVAVAVRASGVLATTSGATTYTIPAEGHLPIHIPIEAKAVGSGKLVFAVKSAKGQDEVTVEEEVSSLASIESVVVAGEIPSAKAPQMVNEPVGDLSKVRADVGGFDYRLSTTPLVGLASSLHDLVEYPYGCTEQLTSRLVPLMRLRGMAKDLNVTLPSNIDVAVRSSLESLLSHQQDDGGFGFWRESKKSEAWLTLLALSALQTAHQHGYVVPASSVDSAQKWLEKPDGGLDAGARAMREDLFASLGKPRPAELRALAADATLPLYAQALTAHALATVDRAEAQHLLSRMTARAQVSGAVVTFMDEASLVPRTNLSSSARTTAMVLRAMLAIDPRGPLVTKTVRGLLSQRREGRWQTTQDSAWALAALEDARALYRPSQGRTSAEFLFDRHVVAKTTFEGLPGGETRMGTISMGRLLGAPGAAVSFESDGDRPLYYEGALRYARIDLPASPLDHGLTIARTLRPLSSASSEFHVGDYVVADLVLVTTTPRDLVVVDDPIPAGFEAVNTSFAAIDQAAPIVTELATTLTHRELRDDRVVSFFDSLPAGVQRTRYALRAISAGRFAQPPARAECMYAPDIFGRTASTWVEVH